MNRKPAPPPPKAPAAPKITVLPLLDLNQRYTIPEGSAYLRQSRSKTYKDIRTGALPIIRDGSRVYIPGRAIAARSAIPA